MSGELSRRDFLGRSGALVVSFGAALVGLAADRLGVPADQLTVSNGVITATSDALKKVTYGELVGGKKLSLALNPNAKRRDPRSWTVLGTSVPRVDLPALVTAQFQF